MNKRAQVGFSLVLSVGVLAWMYADSLAYLFSQWTGSEDYGHGIFVPLISAVLVWRVRHSIARENSWLGLTVIAVGLLLFVVGELSTLYVILHLSLWMVIAGLAMTWIGLRGTRVIAFPLGYLLTAIPLPVFFSSNLSAQLQLWSSALGVNCLQLVGVMAFREGNVIDLGPVQLQVVEACSGIRYLLPLMSLALLCAYFFKGRTWQRVALVLSAIPISVLVNGFRIGMIGVLVELYGQEAAEGFYHLFEGWVLFMASLGLLILEMWAMTKLGEHKSLAFRDRFAWVEMPEDSRPATSSRPGLSMPGPAYLCSVALLVPFTFIASAVTEREPSVPSRMSFIDFPIQIGDWQGTRFALDKQYVDSLRLDDYALVDYRSGSEPAVNFYAAYYRAQRKGQSAHSPQSCLPAGGWEIASLTVVEWASLAATAEPLQANRAVIEKADRKQIVLYWFKQRERVLTDEYLVKWYLLWDAFFRKRTDGALVRLASLVGPGESEAQVDQRLRDLAFVIRPKLIEFVPD